MMNILVSLRLICNHPLIFLYRKNYSSSDYEDFDKEVIQ